MSLPLWFRLMPRPWRRNTYTSRLGFKPQEIAGLVFKIADRRSEWEQAFRLLHDVSVQAGYYQPKASGMRISPCHAVPSTAVFIALKGEQVVGTMTLVEDSPLGVPMEPIFPDEVNRYRVQKRRVAEVSALAVHKAFRGTGMTMTMNRVMWRWAYFYRQLTDLVISVRTMLADYYESVLLFEQIGPSRPYRGLNDTPVVPMRLDLQTAVERYQRVYGEKPLPGLRNIYRFMVLDRDITAVKLPRRLNQVWVENDEVPPMGAEDFSYFFVEQEPVLADVDEHRLRYLAKCYPGFDVLRLAGATGEGYGASSKRTTVS